MASACSIFSGLPVSKMAHSSVSVLRTSSTSPATSSVLLASSSTCALPRAVSKISSIVATRSHEKSPLYFEVFSVSARSCARVIWST